MNLNEECLLQFLKNDIPFHFSVVPSVEKEPTRAGGFLHQDIRRVFKHKNYVSYPGAVLFHRSSNRTK